MEKNIVYSDSVKKRLDVFLSEYFSDYSRSFFQRIISQGLVLVNGKRVKAQYRLKGGESIEISFPPPKTTEVIPENIPLDIVYEDDDMVIVNKKRGMVVHPATSHESGTLVNALVYHFGSNLSSGYEKMRPGIVHRLDKGTSGIIVVAKTDKMQNYLSKIFLERNIKKTYKAIVMGDFEEKSGRIDIPIKRGSVDRKKMSVSMDGKRAITEFKVAKSGINSSLLDINLLTGRTHQIRVHMSYLKHPIINDTLYGYKGKIYDFMDGIALHAYKIEFFHPILNKNMEFVAEIPDDFQRVMELEGLV